MADDGYARTIGKAKPSSQTSWKSAHQASSNTEAKYKKTSYANSKADKESPTTERWPDNDPVVGAILHAVEMLMRTVEWSVDASDTNDEEALDYASFVAEMHARHEPIMGRHALLNPLIPHLRLLSPRNRVQAPRRTRRRSTLQIRRRGESAGRNYPSEASPQSTTGTSTPTAASTASHNNKSSVKHSDETTCTSQSKK